MEKIYMIILRILIVGMTGLNAIAQTCHGQQYQDLGAVDFYIQLNLADHAILLDTRTYREHRRVRIPGAVLASTTKILGEISDTCDYEQPVFVYCSNGYRSSSACKHLIDRGFVEVYNLKGGLIGWRQHNYPLDKKHIEKKRRVSQ